MTEGFDLFDVLLRAAPVAPVLPVKSCVEASVTDVGWSASSSLGNDTATAPDEFIGIESDPEALSIGI